MKYAELLDSYIYKSGKSLQTISEECEKLGEKITVSYLSKLRNNKMPAPSFDKTIVLSKVIGIEPEKLLAASFKDETENNRENLKRALEKSFPNADPEEIFEKTWTLSADFNHILNPITDFPSDEEWNHIIPSSIEGIPESDMVSIPILGTIRAGQAIDRIEHYEGTYPVLKKTINGYDAFWLKVKGESMSGDEIHDGDLVCIIKTTEVNPTDITAVAVNGDEATLKRVKLLDGKCILTPSNREMEPMIYPADMINIIGKVVGFQRYYK